MNKDAKITWIAFLLLVLGFLLSSRLPGQSIQYGKLVGKIMLASGEALPGVAVEITSPALMSGKKITVTSEKGEYIFLNLPIGKYKLTASLPGFKTVSQKDFRLSPGAVTTINLVLEQGVLEETVMVTGTAPTVDVKTSTIDTKLDKEMLEKIPTNRDAFYDLTLTTPGMFASGADSSWLPSPTAYGGATNENAFLVNGVNTTNPRGASWGSMVNVNYNALEEVQVISLGSKAEYGTYSGVAVDVITKSGGDTIQGNIGFYSQLGKTAINAPANLHDLGANWLFFDPADQLMTRPQKDYEFNLTLGGPLIRKKLWFYSGIAHSLTDTDTPYFKPLKEYKNLLLDLKLTAEPWNRQRAWVAYHFERTRNGNESWGDTWDESMVYNQHNINNTVSAQWESFLTDKTMMTAKYLGFWTNQEPMIPAGLTHPGYINWWKWVDQNMGVGGAFPYIEAQKSSRNTLQADVSHYADNFLGRHDFKFGVQYTKSKGNWMGGYFHGFANFAYPLRDDQNISNLQDWYGDTGLLIYVSQEHNNPYLTVRHSANLGVFLDDQWSIGNRLTLNVGLRFDRMTARYGQGKVYEQPATAYEINDPLPVLRDREGSGNIFNFKTISPRLGFAYLLTKDGKTAFKGNYGRYYAPLSLENLSRFGPDMPLMHRYRLDYTIPWSQVDLDGDGYISNQEFYAACRLLPDIHPDSTTDEGEVDQSWRLKVAPGTRNTFTDQLTVILEREIINNLSVAFSYIYKNTGNLMINWPINRQTKEPWEYEKVPFTTSDGQHVQLYSIIKKDYNGDGLIDMADIRWIMDHNDLEVRNLHEFDGQKAKRHFQGFQLTVNKRYADRWQLLASVLLTDSDGVAARTTDQSWNIDGAMIMDTPFISSLNQLINNMEGPLPFTPKWEVKFAGAYTIPRIEINLGFRFRFNTGRALWPLEMIPVVQSWDEEIDPAKIISPTDGETGSQIIAINPKNPKRYPPAKILDLSLGKNFSLGKAGSIDLTLDILNLLNDGTCDKAGFRLQDLGRVYAINIPRIVRLGILYQF